MMACQSEEANATAPSGTNSTNCDNKTLIVYYSYTNNTEQIVDDLKTMINDRILAKAKELLSISSPRGGREGVLSVTQVSQRLGFEYPQHFVRFFKALTGKTPTQWRAA